MNAEEARKHIQALKGFYIHLWTFVMVMIGLAVTNVMTYLQGDPAIWVVLPFVFWGGSLFLHGWVVHNAHRGKKWEEEKFRELMGWSASGEELANLRDRVNILLSIVASSENAGKEGGRFDIEEAKAALEDVRRAIEYYQAPLDRTEQSTIDKDRIIRLIEQLEASVTTEEFRRHGLRSI